jgi:hypothetical protein
MLEAILKHFIKFIVWMAAALGCYYLSKYLGTLHLTAGRISILVSIALLIVLKVKLHLSILMVLFGGIVFFLIFMLGGMSLIWILGGG